MNVVSTNFQFQWLLTIGSVFIFIFLAAGSALGWIASDFNTIQHDFSYQPPSFEYWMGTDIFGRNVLSRAIRGCQIALSVGFFSSLLAVALGTLFGLISGYFGKWVDSSVVWLYTTLDSIPYILMIIALAYSLGPGLKNLIFALGLTMWTKPCRLIRAETQMQKNKMFVQAATAIGASATTKIFTHIFPNTMHIIFIQFSLLFVSAIQLEVFMSYLGLGVEPGDPSWGLMISDAKLEILNGIWWNLLAASLFLTLITLTVNSLVDLLNSRSNS